MGAPSFDDEVVQVPSRDGADRTSRPTMLFQSLVIHDN